MLLADALTLALREWGVRYVFGVSGANIEHVHDAIARLGGDALRSVMTKTEVGAAFMADAHARVHRTLGVCCATSGGGMMNLAVGVAEAYAESVPMLALVGQVPTALEGRGGFQDSSGIGRTVDAMGLFRSMAKYVGKVTAPSDFWGVLHEAVEAALTGRPGPAVLLLPRDLQASDVPPMPSWMPRSLDGFRAEVAPRDATSVRVLLERIRRAQRPVFVVGTGVARCARPEAVVEFLRACRAPVVTTMASTGAFDHDDPQYLGVVGVAGHPSAHAYLNDQADLIVAVGTGLDVMTRGPLAPACRRADLAIVNVDAGAVVRALEPSLVVEADAGIVFEQLHARWRERSFTCPPVEGYVRTRFRATLAPVPADAPPPPAGALRQSEALALLQPYLPERGHLVFDAGNCAASALHYLDVPADTTTTIALGMGGMGYSLGGAAGAQLGSAPGTRTVVLCGDGAFLMAGLEVHCAVELGLPILFVVFNNARHGMCVTRQQLMFGDRRECSEYAPVKIAQLAGALGEPAALWTARVETAAELAAALDDYHRHHVDGPGVLELHLPVEEVPPFTPFLPADAATYEVAPPRRGHARRVA
ncbi:MAG: thiamine pyrophosphate-binding protein [Kofleriaceae bacterium]|nr:thiamine pyrophosphate-binding protein [Myxococcales bacterium]MCB9564777.1 thiamine pyrophosphate-binding protein [Kofleriaceae bacterium]MCB9572826.1 thiamine pyrophosphate-binding protein [Kofleriaceae bacterium]